MKPWMINIMINPSIPLKKMLVFQQGAQGIIAGTNKSSHSGLPVDASAVFGVSFYRRTNRSILYHSQPTIIQEYKIVIKC